MESYKVSVFTCVYNRAHTIHRVFRSMKAQTYQNLEHVIVDDGSTDGLDELVQQYIAEVPFPVVYLKKPNGGKHTATNLAWDHSTGDFIIQLDSDDELLPDAISFLVSTYEAIPDAIKDEYWCVHGRCMEHVHRNMIGEPYPEGINELPAQEAKAIAKTISGDKVGLMRRDRLEGWRYPEPAHVKFVSEAYLWIPINLRYRTWYTNHIVLEYYVNDEGACLSKPSKNRQTFSNKAYYYAYLLENRKAFAIKGKARFYTFLKLALFYTLATKDYKREYSYFLKRADVSGNVLLALLKIPAILASCLLKKKWSIT